jgi:hypothetical protein
VTSLFYSVGISYSSPHANGKNGARPILLEKKTYLLLTYCKHSHPKIYVRNKISKASDSCFFQDFFGSLSVNYAQIKTKKYDQTKFSKEIEKILLKKLTYILSSLLANNTVQYSTCANTSPSSAYC